MPPAQRPNPRTPAPAPPETVDPVWILKAAGAVVALGLVCAYVTLCVFFYTGQWQFVLHPSRAVTRTPAALQMTFTPVRFGDDHSGQPQLSGWWLPSDSPDDPTALMLHNQTGSMGEALPLAKALHDARLNVLLFDYRGYGQSGGNHPSQATMRQDAEQALAFLMQTRAIPASRIIAFGDGLAASLATRLCAEHPELPALILTNADGDTATRVAADQRSRIVPLGLLFHERFPLAEPLHALRTPKLLISYTGGGPPLEAERAADPKMTAELAPSAGPAAVTPVLRRFLDSYVPHPAPTLVPGRP